MFNLFILTVHGKIESDKSLLDGGSNGKILDIGDPADVPSGGIV